MNPRAPIVLALVAVLACSTVSTRAERIEEGLVGLPARTLQTCLGEARSVDADGAVEYVTYHWVIDFVSNEPISPAEEVWQRRRRDREGDQFPWPGSVTSDEEYGHERRREEVKQGYCQLVFELRERKVYRVEAEGRTGDNLRWNDSCMLKAQRCLPRR